MSWNVSLSSLANLERTSPFLSFPAARLEVEKVHASTRLMWGAGTPLTLIISALLIAIGLTLVLKVGPGFYAMGGTSLAGGAGLTVIVLALFSVITRHSLTNLRRPLDDQELEFHLRQEYAWAMHSLASIVNPQSLQAAQELVYSAKVKKCCELLAGNRGLVQGRLGYEIASEWGYQEDVLATTNRLYLASNLLSDNTVADQLQDVSSLIQTI